MQAGTAASVNEPHQGSGETRPRWYRKSSKPGQDNWVLIDAQVSSTHSQGTLELMRKEVQEMM